MNKAVFLDRDGVLNYDFGYVWKPEDLQVLPGVPKALNLLQGAGFKLIVVSNQSGIARGYYGADQVREFNRHLNYRIQKLGGPEIDDFYFCGDLHDTSYSRKPNPGMLEDAATDHDIDLPRSYMVGDKPSDVTAGIKAGCANSYYITQNSSGLLSIAQTIIKELPDDLQEATE